MISLGIDCGTQSTKTIALNGISGEILASASKSYGLISGLPSGHLEQDPHEWIDALDQTMREVLKKLGKRSQEVLSIGVSGQQHGFVPLDSEGNVIRPAKLWCDTSTTSQCDQIRNHFKGREHLISLIGNDILPGFTAPKILWLKQNEPKNFKKLSQVFLPHDYLNWYLTGVSLMECGDASGSALLDVRNRIWSKEICDWIDPDLISKLPPLQSSEKKAGYLKNELAKSWGLGSQVVVSTGGGDNMMGAIGTGNTKDGIVTASLGTSGTIYAFSSKPMIDPEGEIAAFCDCTGGWLALACTMNVTVATESISKMFGWNHQQLSEAIASVQPGAEGLLFIPYLQGERTPNLPQGTGTYHGFNLHNMTPAHMARATMEGVTLGMAYGLRRMKKMGIQPREIRLTGGGSRNKIWRQICADIFGSPVVCLKNSEGAAFGAAIQALGSFRNERLSSLCDQFVSLDESTRLIPIPTNTAIYENVFDRMNSLIQKIYTPSQS
ncbi:MAG: xylulokinase [Verrucomicrobiota bacterium]